MASKKNPATASEKAHMEKVAALGCVAGAVTEVGRCGRPAEVHHLTGAGMGLRSSHYETIPLCPHHHRTGPFGHAVHNGTRTFEDRYGYQRELLEVTLDEINKKENGDVF